MKCIFRIYCIIECENNDEILPLSIYYTLIYYDERVHREMIEEFCLACHFVVLSCFSETYSYINPSDMCKDYKGLCEDVFLIRVADTITNILTNIDIIPPVRQSFVELKIKSKEIEVVYKTDDSSDGSELIHKFKYDEVPNEKIGEDSHVKTLLKL